MSQAKCHCLTFCALRAAAVGAAGCTAEPSFEFSEQLFSSVCALFQPHHQKRIAVVTERTPPPTSVAPLGKLEAASGSATPDHEERWPVGCGHVQRCSKHVLLPLCPTHTASALRRRFSRSSPPAASPPRAARLSFAIGDVAAPELHTQFRVALACGTALTLTGCDCGG